MVRGAAQLAVLLTIGASSASLAAEAPFLGDWARGDGETHIRVEPCGAAFCGVNTWVRPGVSGEKVGDTLVANLQPSRGRTLVRHCIRPTAQSTLHNEGPCRQ